MPDPQTGPPEQKAGLRTIRASEIGEYEYCSRAWWYKHIAKVPVNAETSGRMERGREAHRQHGRGVALSIKLRAAGVALLVLGLLALIMALTAR